MDTAPASADPAAARPLAIAYRAIRELVPDPRNARTHPKRQVAQIAASIRAFGFANPLLVDEQGRLIAWHGRNRTNVWDYALVNSLRGSRRADLELHRTVKPVALVADAICDVTRQGELVLDIFLGSGTSLIAAERVGRRFRGLDIDPAYVDVAITRWEQLTGRTAQLVNRAHGEAAA